jgi:nitrite reductase (NADH) small subunit
VTASTTWHDIGSARDLAARGFLVARVAGREIGVMVDATTGAPRAFRNRCPHRGAPLCRGTVRRRLAGTPGTYELSGDSMVHCPWHGWQFDLATGRCPDDPHIRVAVYNVRIEDGRVLVDA